MEPAKIDWKRIESVFVEDKLYENINAPKWVDFLAAEDVPVDDEAWFCRPDCKHPKTAEDFLRTPPSSKLPRFLERLPLGDRNLRLKRRVQGQSSLTSNDKSKFNGDNENQDPNSATPQNHQPKITKCAIKSSSEKTNNIPSNETTSQNSSQNNEILPRLKSTLSARNLFAGKVDIMNQITEFCNELKKLATKAREREENNVADDDKLMDEKKSETQEGLKKEMVNENSSEVLGETNGRDQGRKPLVEMVEKEKSGSTKPKWKKRFEDTENIIPMSLNLENVKQKGNERSSLLHIRTNPPTPQCFSAARAAAKATPSKASVSRSMERRILEGTEEARKEESATPAAAAEKAGRTTSSVVDGGESTRALDVFWFFKPCTLSG